MNTAPKQPRQKSAASIQSVDRAVAVLELFDRDRPRLSAAEVAKLTGLNRATAYRFCQALVSVGYLSASEDGKFRPGLKTVSLAQAALSSFELPDLAMPYLRELEEETGEAVNMAALDGDEIVYLARVTGTRLITLRLTVGSRLPAHATSLGRAILAFLPEEQQDQVLGRKPLKKLTEHTTTSPIALKGELGRIRESGYAVNDQELALGLRSIAAPVFNSAGHPIAAVNVPLPYPATDDRIKVDLAPKVMATAEKISQVARQMGMEGPAR